MTNIKYDLIDRNTIEGKKIHRDFLENAEIGSLYFKCIIAPYDLGIDSEYWGDCYDDLKTAKKKFAHDVDEELDDLDYGFMTICAFVVEIDEKTGKRIGRNTTKRYVCNFGHWEDEETFLHNRFGYDHNDYLNLLSIRFASKMAQ